MNKVLWSCLPERTKPLGLHIASYCITAQKGDRAISMVLSAESVLYAKFPLLNMVIEQMQREIHA